VQSGRTPVNNQRTPAPPSVTAAPLQRPFCRGPLETRETATHTSKSRYYLKRSCRRPTQPLGGYIRGLRLLDQALAGLGDLTSTLVSSVAPHALTPLSKHTHYDICRFYRPGPTLEGTKNSSCAASPFSWILLALTPHRNWHLDSDWTENMPSSLFSIPG